MSLDVRAFPDWFEELTFTDVPASCDHGELTDTGQKIQPHATSMASRTSCSQTRKAHYAESPPRFLAEVPGSGRLRAIFEAAHGNEIGTGIVRQPVNPPNALAANGFGFFLDRASDLPALPGCEGESSPARSLRSRSRSSLPVLRM